MKQVKTIYREIPAPHLTLADFVLDVVADRVLLVIEQMDVGDREPDEQEPERWDGMQ